ncbi:MAG: CoB--CoM heterodisulfide reductase iron-sulfur subunit B family protein [Moorellaceae bacterium]
MRRLAFFPGCSAPVRALGYELAARKLMDFLGVELVEIPGFRCCGYPLKSLDKEAALLIAAYNLAQVGDESLPIMTLCNACASNLMEADLLLKDGGGLGRKIRQKLETAGFSYRGGTRVLHLLRVLAEFDFQKLVRRTLAGLKVAVHEGCHFARPSEAYRAYGLEGYGWSGGQGILDRLVVAVGAESIDYEGKEDCCGGGLMALRPDLMARLSAAKVEQAGRAGADCLVVACPACGIALSAGQGEAELPVLYLPQLLGLSLGLNPEEELGLELNQVSADSVLEKLGV